MLDITAFEVFFCFPYFGKNIAFLSQILGKRFKNVDITAFETHYNNERSLKLWKKPK